MKLKALIQVVLVEERGLDYIKQIRAIQEQVSELQSYVGQLGGTVGEERTDYFAKLENYGTEGLRISMLIEVPDGFDFRLFKEFRFRRRE